MNRVRVAARRIGIASLALGAVLLIVALYIDDGPRRLGAYADCPRAGPGCGEIYFGGRRDGAASVLRSVAVWSLGASLPLMAFGPRGRPSSSHWTLKHGRSGAMKVGDSPSR
jgi:hypothetical protein